MDDLEDRVRRLEQLVMGMGDVISDQAREIERLRTELESRVRQSDLVVVQQQVRDTRQLALAALSA